jgi:hypothetical protein
MRDRRGMVLAKCAELTGDGLIVAKGSRGMAVEAVDRA